MDLGSILFITAIILLAGFFIARPIFEKSSHPVTAKDQAISALLSEQERVLDALQELDADYALKKIPEADYPIERKLLLNSGADILKQLDELQPNRNGAQAKDPVEAAIAARRRAQAAAAQPDDQLEAIIAARRRTQKETTGGFCPQCGHTIQKSDKFCAKCGTTL